MSKELTTETKKSSIAIGTYQGSRSILLNSLGEIHTFATMVTKTDLVPKGYRGKPEDATVAIIYGMEIGLPPLASLQNISVVNGTPAVWGDAQLSLVQSSGKYEYHKSSFEGVENTDAFKAIFEIKRIGAKDPVIKEFSVADAKKAGLWNKSGTWTTHPKVMLSYKARAFALREGFADILKGMHSAEEMEGEQMIDATPKSVSKTANAHTPPAAIDQSFLVPADSTQVDLEEVIAEASGVSGPANNRFYRQTEEAFAEDHSRDVFEEISKNVKMITTARGVNAYMAGAADKMAYLDQKASHLKDEIVSLVSQKLEEVK